VGTRTGLDDMGKRKILSLPGPDPAAVEPVDIRYTKCAISAHSVDDVNTNSSVIKMLKDDLNFGIDVLLFYHTATSGTDLVRPVQYSFSTQSSSPGLNTAGR
jgi:hypothetical protein